MGIVEEKTYLNTITTIYGSIKNSKSPPPYLEESELNPNLKDNAILAFSPPLNESNL